MSEVLPLPPQMASPVSSRVDRLLEGAAGNRRRPAAVPVIAEDAAQALEEPRVAEARHKAIAPVLVDHDARDTARELDHPAEEPPGRLAGVQGQQSRRVGAHRHQASRGVVKTVSYFAWVGRRVKVC